MSITKNFEPTAPNIEEDIVEDPFIKRQKEILRLFEENTRKNNNNTKNNNTNENNNTEKNNNQTNNNFTNNNNTEKNNNQTNNNFESPKFFITDSNDDYLEYQRRKDLESEDEKLAKLLQESENQTIKKRITNA